MSSIFTSLLDYRIWAIFYLLSGTCNIDLNAQNKNVQLKGSITLTSDLNSIRGINARRPPFGYSIAGNPVLSLYGIDLPFSFILSNYGRTFRQPFNQFGVSPRYKTIQFHLGYRSMNWSKYSLGGHRFLGAGLDGRLGIFRLGFVKGRFLKSIPVDTSKKILGFNPAFSRNGWAAKIGIGNSKTYLDLIYFKAKDDLRSIPTSPRETYLKPSENAVLGLKARVGFIKYFSAQIDLGISGLTRDLRANALPIDSANIPTFVQSILTPNISTQVNLAGEGKIALNIRSFGVDVNYKHIEPGYVSQGSYYFRSDVEQKSLGMSLGIWKGQLNLSGRFGLENNNINLTKTSTTQRKIFSSNLNLRFNRHINVNAQYANYGLTQVGTKIKISDTIRLNNITKSLVINPNLLFRTGVFNHSISVVYSDQTLDDKNKYTVKYTSIKSKTINLNYNLNLGPNGLSVVAGLNRTQSELSLGKTLSNGVLLGLTKNYKSKHLFFNANLNYNINSFEETSNGSTKRISFQTQWSPYSSHSFRLLVYHMINLSKNDQVSRSFSESNLRLSYTYNFTTNKHKKR